MKGKLANGVGIYRELSPGEKLLNETCHIKHLMYCTIFVFVLISQITYHQLVYHKDSGFQAAVPVLLGQFLVDSCLSYITN